MITTPKERYAFLEVIKNGQVIDSLELRGKSSYLLGRNEESCDFVLYHESISRQHALLLYDEEENVHIMDLQSGFFNKKKVYLIFF